MRFFFKFFALMQVGLIASFTQASTDIYLFSFNQQQLISVKNINQRKGYDNQPVFLPDNKGLLYTSQRNDLSQAQTDIFLYDIVKQRHLRLTRTLVSEYSPTPISNNQEFSTVVVEQGGLQKLWHYHWTNEDQKAAIDKRSNWFGLNHKQVSSERFFNDIEPVGYHAWGTHGELILFKLGEPHTLQLTKVGKETSEHIADDIGRTLAYIPMRNAYSFSYKKNAQNWLVELDAKTQLISPLVLLPDSVQDYAWMDADTLVFSNQKQLFKWQRGNKDPVLWLDIGQYCPTKVSRLAFSHAQQRTGHWMMALVCDEPSSTKD